jgi:hypothetical protein
VVAWATRDTLITTWDVVKTILRPSASAAAAFGISLLMASVLDGIHGHLLKLMIESVLFLGTYSLALLLGFGQLQLYVRLLSETGILPFPSRRSATTE